MLLYRNKKNDNPMSNQPKNTWIAFFGKEKSQNGPPKVLNITTKRDNDSEKIMKSHRYENTSKLYTGNDNMLRTKQQEYSKQQTLKCSIFNCILGGR